MKRFLSILLMSALLTGVVPILAFAEEGTDSTEQVVEGGDPAEDTNDVDSGDEVDDDDDDGSDDVTDDVSDDDDDDGSDDVADDDDDDDDDDDAVETEVESDEDVEVDEDLSDEVEDAVEAVAEEALESEGEVDSEEGGDETVVSEEVDESDLNDEMQEDLEGFLASGDLPDSFYLSVQWGMFPVEGAVDQTASETDWSGSVSFADDDGTVSLAARPYKLLRFEKDQDSLDFENTTFSQTNFSSSIFGHHDGVLFKVRADLEDVDTKIVFDTAYQNTQLAVYLTDLIASGSVEFTVGEYTVVMNVWTREDWVDENSKHRGEGSGFGQSNSEWVRPTDAEEGSWYESYMNYAVDAGLFQGYQDGNGEFDGRIGPGDQLTRFQLVKVMTRLAETLGMGVGAVTCDETTNVSNTETDWMGVHWARGYVQCALDSGLPMTLIDEVIGGSLEVGEEATLRWEVLVTAAEFLGLDVPVREEVSEDVEDSELEDDEKDAVAYFYDLGVVSGYSDGTFKPDRTVNRAEMFKIVAMLIESLGL